MAREICPIRDFIFRSIWTGLLTDMVDVELTIRMVKGIYTYRKDHMAESMAFLPWSRTVIPFPSLQKKIQAYQDENRQTSAWNKGHTAPYFPTQPQPKCRCTLEKTRTRCSNQRHRFNPIKIECYNMQDRETMDFNKIDILEPTPKQLCTNIHRECTYCKYDAPHPSATLLDWSSEDWDGKKVKGREQCPLLDFNVLEKQLQRTLQNRAPDIPQDLLHDNIKDRQEVT